MRLDIHVWHLEVTDASLVPVAQSRSYRVEHIGNVLPEYARFLYHTVGAPWTWYMRLRWQYSDWKARFENEAVSLWVAYQDGSPLGYVEYERQANDSVEICYFGLVPEYIGRGVGKAFLEDAIRIGWELGGKRVWLHTCSLDHPNALSNYKSRGFVVFKEEKLVDDVPDGPIEPWPGADKPLT